MVKNFEFIKKHFMDYKISHNILDKSVNNLYEIINIHLGSITMLERKINSPKCSRTVVARLINEM